MFFASERRETGGLSMAQVDTFLPMLLQLLQEQGLPSIDENSSTK